jgi:hypothetical protein
MSSEKRNEMCDKLEHFFGIPGRRFNSLAKVLLPLEMDGILLTPHWREFIFRASERR